jgi:hypothetical protein
MAFTRSTKRRERPSAESAASEAAAAWQAQEERTGFA